MFRFTREFPMALIFLCGIIVATLSATKLVLADASPGASPTPSPAAPATPIPFPSPSNTALQLGPLTVDGVFSAFSTWTQPELWIRQPARILQIVPT
jgi:hypothetical protein